VAASSVSISLLHEEELLNVEMEGVQFSLVKEMFMLCIGSCYICGHCMVR